MKYAWVCAHCGAECYYTDENPRGRVMEARLWVTHEKRPIKRGAAIDPCFRCGQRLIRGSAYLRSPIHDVSLPSGGEARPEPKPGDGAQDTGDNSGDNHDPNLVRKVSEQHLHNNDIDEGEKRR